MSLLDLLWEILQHEVDSGGWLVDEAPPQAQTAYEMGLAGHCEGRWILTDAGLDFLAEHGRVSWDGTGWA